MGVQDGRALEPLLLLLGENMLSGTCLEAKVAPDFILDA